MARRPVSYDFEEIYPHEEFAPLVRLAMEVGGSVARRVRPRTAQSTPSGQGSGPSRIRNTATPGT